MAKYHVRDGHKRHDGKEYAPGEVIECDEEVAKKLRLDPATEEKDKKAKK